MTNDTELNPEPIRPKPDDAPIKQDGIIITGLAELPEKAMLDETALADVLGVTKRTIRRMVARYELPPSIKLRGRSMWFAGKVLAYLEAQAERLARDAERNAAKLKKLAS